MATYIEILGGIDRVDLAEGAAQPSVLATPSKIDPTYLGADDAKTTDDSTGDMDR